MSSRTLRMHLTGHATVLLLSAAACTPSSEPSREPPSSSPVAATKSPTEPEPEPKRNAIVIVIDTLRADAAERARTPNLDALASEGTRVDHAWSAGTWTVPSVISILTGMPVRQHGWDLPSGRIGRYPAFPNVPTLPETLREHAFRTVGLYANTYLSEELGFQRGFDVWRRLPDKAMARAVEAEVATWRHDERHFLYVHILGPHSPLDPSPEARARWNVADSWFEGRGGLTIGRAKRGREEGVEEAYRAAYHAAVEDSDVLLGDILAALGSQRADSVIVVTSDHGELLGEHDTFGHGRWLWQPLTHVPLVVAGGGTLPSHLGIASVPDIVTTSVGVSHRWPVSRADALPLVAQREGRVAVSHDGRWKGIWSDETSAFDLKTDPGELRSAPMPSDTERARSAFEDRFPAGTAGTEDVDLHPDTVESLRLLGYVEEEGDRK